MRVGLAGKSRQLYRCVISGATSTRPRASSSRQTLLLADLRPVARAVFVQRPGDFVRADDVQALAMHIAIEVDALGSPRVLPSKTTRPASAASLKGGHDQPGAPVASITTCRRQRRPAFGAVHRASPSPLISVSSAPILLRQLQALASRSMPMTGKPPDSCARRIARISR